MSVKLEPGGVYVLPDAIDGEHYAVVEAVQDSGEWHLIESHVVNVGGDAFQQRASLPSDQLLRFSVASDGRIAQTAPGNGQSNAPLSIARLSLIGYIRNGSFEPVPEGL